MPAPENASRNPLPDVGPAFLAFIEPARASPALWRLGVGILLVAATFVVAVIGLQQWIPAGFVALGLAAPVPDPFQTRPPTVLLLLAAFGGVWVGLALAVRLIHRRPMATLIGPKGARNPAGRHFVFGLLVAMGVSVPGAIILFAFGSPVQARPVLVWALWLLPGLPLLFLQTASEELLFRGYIQQQLAVRFRSRWVWWFLPSLLFGALHFDAVTFGPNAWLVVAGTAIFGLIAADVTARTGTIGAAVGLHFVNNVFAFCLVGTAGHLSGLSLFVLPISPADSDALRPWLIADVASLLVLYGLWLAVFRLNAGFGQARRP